MTLSPSPLLGITSLEANQDSAHITVNEGTVALEAFGQLSVKSRTTAAQPGSPANGDRYLLTGSPTGAQWSTQANKLAVYVGTAWKFFTPKEGMFSWIDDQDLFMRYTGAAWVDVAVSSLILRAPSILNPTTSENLTLFRADRAMTIRKIVALVRGTSPSRTWTLRKASDRSTTGTEVITSGTVTTNSTTGASITSFSSATLAAGDWLWLTTTAGSGTVTELHLSIYLTEG